MSYSAQRKLPLQAARPVYRTLQGWSLGMLIAQGAVGHNYEKSFEAISNIIAHQVSQLRQ